MNMKKILLILPFISLAVQEGNAAKLLYCPTLDATKFVKSPPEKHQYTYFADKHFNQMVIKAKTPDDWRAMKGYSLGKYTDAYALTNISSPDGKIDKEDGRPLCVYTFSFDGLTFKDGKNNNEVSFKYQGDVTDCVDFGPGAFSCDALSAPATR